MFLSSLEDSTSYHRTLQQQNFDSIAVIMAGLIIGGWFYPFYEKKAGRPMKLSHKFAIGSFLGTLGMVCKLSVLIIDFYNEYDTITHLRIVHLDALLIDVFIIKKFNESGSEVNILWQSPAFLFIGFGEIFAISAAYEATFNIAPKNLKALSSAVNIFFVGGLPQFIINWSLMATESWFVASNGSDDLTVLANYATAGTMKYLGLMVGVGVFGTLLNLLPAVDRFLVRTLELAAAADKLYFEDNSITPLPVAGTKHNFPVQSVVLNTPHEADKVEEAATDVGSDPEPMASATMSKTGWSSFMKQVKG